MSVSTDVNVGFGCGSFLIAIAFLVALWAIEDRLERIAIALEAIAK